MKSVRTKPFREMVDNALSFLIRMLALEVERLPILAKVEIDLAIFRAHTTQHPGCFLVITMGLEAEGPRSTQISPVSRQLRIVQL
ncbi:MAG: hypothetical protein GVY36_08835 [Verrucomicrobia bacterium]|jgi:hypothetical protein|nr:hypothetical protein [Verrucomicrobiota bacterium]